MARVNIDIDGGVADVRLNRPDKLNALDWPMFEALVAAGAELAANRSVRAVVLSGEGRAFCAGLDTSIFQEGFGPDSQDGAGLLAPMDGTTANAGQMAAWTWAELPMPVIAAVTGPTFGGGLQVAMAADIRIVSPDAQLSVMEIRWGLVPDMTGTVTLPRLVGVDVAKELTLTGRRIDGEEAARIGLATRLSGTPRDDALALAREIAGQNPHAVRAAKALIDQWDTRPLSESFADAAKHMTELMGSPNQREAVAAVTEGRPAQFED